MKNIIPLIFVIAIYFITPSESQCSTDDFTPVPVLNPLLYLGRWYTTSRFSNGNDTSICLWEEFTIETLSSIHEVLNRLYENGTGYTKAQQTSTITQVNPNSTVGISDVKYSTGIEQIKYTTAVDYYDYSLVRACYEGEEYLWTYTRSQYPSNRTLAKIRRVQLQQGVNISRLTSASCRKVPPGEIIA